MWHDPELPLAIIDVLHYVAAVAVVGAALSALVRPPEREKEGADDY